MCQVYSSVISNLIKLYMRPYLLLFCGIFLFSSCAKSIFYDEFGNKQKGIEYYVAEPYLLITPLKEGGFKSSILTLPGKKRIVEQKSGLGNSTFKISLSNGMFTSGESTFDSQIDEIITSAASTLAPVGTIPAWIEAVNESQEGMLASGNSLISMIDNQILEVSRFEISGKVYYSSAKIIHGQLVSLSGKVANMNADGISEDEKNILAKSFVSLNATMISLINQKTGLLKNVDDAAEFVAVIESLKDISRHWPDFIVQYRDLTPKLYAISYDDNGKMIFELMTNWPNL